jgi:hypothetical protein
LAAAEYPRKTVISEPDISGTRKGGPGRSGSEFGSLGSGWILEAGCRLGIGRAAGKGSRTG